MGLKKKFGLIFLMLFLFIILLAGYLTIDNFYQKQLLIREIKSLPELDITKNKFNKKYVTHGDYRKVEVAIKDCLQEYASNIQNVNKIVDDKKLVNLLSYDNLSKDINYTESIEYVNDSINKINVYIDNLVEMSNEEIIKNNILDYNLDKYYVDLYLSLMMDSDISKKLDESIKYLEEYRAITTNKLKVCNELFLFLNNNKDKYKFEDGEIKFLTNDLYVEYNKMINKITK